MLPESKTEPPAPIFRQISGRPCSQNKPGYCKPTWRIMPGCLYRRLPPKDDSADAPAPQAPSRQSERIWLYQGHCLRSTFSICEGSALENRLRRSPCASSVLEQVRDGIRLKRGFGCGSAMSIKQVCCHCSRLSLSLIASKTGCVSAMQNRASSFCMALDFHYL